jgi:hypothetical protein
MFPLSAVGTTLGPALKAEFLFPCNHFLPVGVLLDGCLLLMIRQQESGRQPGWRFFGQPGVNSLVHTGMKLLDENKKFEMNKDLFKFNKH